MFGIDELKENIEITETTVECPVKNCNQKVKRQRIVFKREERFKCPTHGIYISPSTFEYRNELDNLLWTDENDLNLLNSIKAVKRESRISRDNSEDAVTWNVFRFLERYDLLASCLSKLVERAISNPKVIYWSYSQTEQNTWSALQNGREQFEIRPAKGSEPDIIVKSDNTLFFIETKLNADNNTVSKTRNPDVQKKYETGGNKWFTRVFKSDYRTVAIVEKKYELMRFWLLGTWIAKQLKLDFYLVNLVPIKQEKNIEEIFKFHITENNNLHFMRATWESIYQQILNNGLQSKEKDMMLEYFKNKITGYDGDGRLQRAFTIYR